LGRARGGVRAAPLAGPEARLLGRRRAAVEPHVRPLRRDRRAGRSAVDAGRGHRDEEHPVEAGILADRRLVAPLVVERGHAACDRAVLAHAFYNASPHRPELAGIGHPPLTPATAPAAQHPTPPTPPPPRRSRPRDAPAPATAPAARRPIPATLPPSPRP